MSNDSQKSQLQDFFDQCSVSSNETYDQFKGLLERLQNSQTRVETACFLSQIRQKYLQMESEGENLEPLNFSFSNLKINSPEGEEKTLFLLQFPSTYTPEEWSFTFYEGLKRYATTEFHGRTLVELGCGNGWITLALAIIYLPQKAYGVDLNPKAITCALLNLYLNALNESGQNILDAEGLSLLDRVDFKESNLLSYFDNKPMSFDHVIGCIPQVLSPEPEAMHTLIAENNSDEFLHSLSNYSAKQGFVEDQFGLGLIAKALEEAIEKIKPNGKIILNLGGRPGAAVLERMMARRGFKVKKIWQTKVEQAADTDIKSLVDIEANSRHKFEFFMSPQSNQPLSATTAYAYAEKGGKIFHSVSIYEARLEFPNWIKSIFQLLKNEHFSAAKSGMDLSYSSLAIAEERFSFLSELAKCLTQNASFPYEDTAGSIIFRQQIASYISNYFHIHLLPSHLLISPTRMDMMNNLFRLLNPKLSLVEDSVYSFFSDQENDVHWQKVLTMPAQIDSTCQLIERLKPDLVCTRLSDSENQNIDSFMRILQLTEQQGINLLLDISHYFEMSSEPTSNAVFRYLASHSFPKHLIITCGLVNNKVHQDLVVCFTISKNKELLDNLVNGAELSYSRTPFLNQVYYGQILQDLLFFQRPKKESQLDDKTALLNASSSEPLIIDPHCRLAFSRPSITTSKLPIKDSTTRLDYGENELPTAGLLKQFVYESFIRQNISALEIDIDPVIEKFINQRFAVNCQKKQLIYANGVAPLFAAIGQICSSEQQTVFFPYGSYDYFVAACHYYSTSLSFIKTEAKNHFKITPYDLEKQVAHKTSSWLYLNAPFINPTGIRYSDEEIEALVATACQLKLNLIIDTIFSGLNFASEDKNSNWKFLNRLSQEKQISIILLGGASKEFSAGGLRFGFSYCSTPNLKEALNKRLSSQPHSTLLYTFKKLYQQMNTNNPALLQTLNQQTDRLKQRAEQLYQTLIECGWQPIKPDGGLFMVAKPEAYIGKKLTLKTSEGEKSWCLDSKNIEQALFYSCQLLINNAVWTGIEDHCRFVLSVNENDFQAALDKLRQFKQLVLT